jgi:multidrug efflux pump subunit AcrB
VAFIVTPWASMRFFKHETAVHGKGHQEADDWSIRLYRRIMTPLIERPLWRKIFLIGVVALLVASFALVGIGWVRVKMLPFDNKSEFQVIIDMPEKATLEETSAVASEMGDYPKSTWVLLPPSISTAWSGTTI